MPRGIAAPQFVHHLGIREPRGNLAAVVQTPAKFGAGNIEDASAVLDLVFRNVAVLVLQVDHHAKRHHGHANISFVLLEQLLCFVRPIEWLAVGIIAWPGVVAADDQVRAAMVFTDQSVPDRFARSAHPHRQRKHGKLHGSRRIFRDQQLVATHAREVVHVTRLCHSDRRMDQQVGFDRLRSTESQLLMGAMHRVASLKRDCTPPAQPRKLGA